MRELKREMEAGEGKRKKPRERREERDEEEGRKERNDRSGLPCFHAGTTDPYVLMYEY